jgi:hypothetical protein
MLDLVEQKAALDRARSSKGHAFGTPGMTATQMQEIDDRIAAAGGPSAIPSRHDIEKSAALAAHALSDVSEGIRYAALQMACDRICFRSDATGAPNRTQDVFDIVVYEIERARSIAEACGQPLAALASEEDANAQGGLAFPYPASAAIDMMRLVFGAMPDIGALIDRVTALEDAAMARPAPWEVK